MTSPTALQTRHQPPSPVAVDPHPTSPKCAVWSEVAKGVDHLARCRNGIRRSALGTPTERGGHALRSSRRRGHLATAPGCLRKPLALAPTERRLRKSAHGAQIFGPFLHMATVSGAACRSRTRDAIAESSGMQSPVV